MKDELPGASLVKTSSRRLKKLAKKLNIPSKTISNSFLVMDRQIWTNQKRHLSMTNAEEQVSSLCT
jgi:replicative DNA helicase